MFKKSYLFGLIFFTALCGVFWIIGNNDNSKVVVKSESNVKESKVTQTITPKSHDKQLRVGIQVGHWKNDELPNEFASIRAYGGGSVVGNYTEWEVNLPIANQLADLLRKQNIVVDVLPATVPANYSADAFISLHSDGNDDNSVSGFKVAASSFDTSGKADKLAELIDKNYEEASGLTHDPNITSDMTEYYVFNDPARLHAVNSKTPAIILEMGFLTNSHDRSFLLHDRGIIASSLTNAIITFLNN